MIEFVDPIITEKRQTEFVIKDNILTLPGEELFDGTYTPDEVIKIKTDDNYIDGSYISINNISVFVKNNEGEPILYKELEEANDYNQLSVYENYSNLVWEEDLNRDYINNSALEEARKQYSDEYIKIAKGKK